jgi:hypothetical protein
MIQNQDPVPSTPSRRIVMLLPPGIPDTSDIVYYRLYLTTDNGIAKPNEPVVVCMQNFDEGDYHSDRFLSGDRWTTEEEAIEALKPFRLAHMMGLHPHQYQFDLDDAAAMVRVVQRLAFDPDGQAMLRYISHLESKLKQLQEQ